MKVESGWPYTPGEEMFSTSQIEIFRRGYADHMGIPKESIIITPYGNQPIVQLPPGDKEGKERLPASLNIEWARHPMFWLDPETKFRYPDEDEWTWAIRIELELTARNLYNAETGTCIDALQYFCELDISNPVDRRRLENYRDGGYDQLLCDFWIPRDPRLSHAESRQIALSTSKAFFEDYKKHKEMNRETAITRLDFEKLAIVNSPVMLEEALGEYIELSRLLMSSTQSSSNDEFIRHRKNFSDLLSNIETLLNELHGYAVSINFVVLLHTEAWKYQEESQKLHRLSFERSQQRKTILEDSIGVIYQDVQNPQNFKNLYDMIGKWFQEIYSYGIQQVEKVNVIAERGRLFEQYELNKSEPAIERMQTGKDKWGMTGFSNPLRDF